MLIPGLPREGTYKLGGLRLVQGNSSVLQAQPAEVTIIVRRLLITSVTSRPLTPQELQQYGVVIRDDNFRAWRYSVGFQTSSGVVEFGWNLIRGPDGRVMIPKTEPRGFSLSGSPDAGLAPKPEPQLVPFTIELPKGELPELEGDGPAPIPGFIVIPNDLGFLNQLFSVILVVQNGASQGSGILLRDLSATLELPSEGLRPAETQPPTVPGQPLPVVNPGPDGVFGTADDLMVLVAQAAGQASWVLEGTKTGQHLVKVQLRGLLDGLASGQPAPIGATVPGVVVVRDPRFALTFFHPWTVRSGEEYEFHVVLSNVSTTPVYQLHLGLPPEELSGAVLAQGEEPTKELESLLPGESKAVSWRLESRCTGQVVASAFNSADPISAEFRFHVGVGELGVPLSPESLVFPKEVELLPDAVRTSATTLLGLAHSLATAPPSQPVSLPPVDKAVVHQRAVELMTHAKRLAWGEELDRVVLSLGLAWQGVGSFDGGFDALRRASRRGHELEGHAAGALSRSLESRGLAAAFAELEELALGSRPVLLVRARGGRSQRQRQAGAFR
jgi:hypothetical protein